MAKTKVLEVKIPNMITVYHYYDRSYKSFVKCFTAVHGYRGKLEFIERPDLTVEEAEKIWRAEFNVGYEASCAAMAALRAV